MPRPPSFLFVVFLPLLFFSGCTPLLTSTVITPTIDSLQQQSDLDLVCAGAPAYLLMLDSLLARNPDSRGLLLAGAQTYTAYSSALEECGSSSERLTAITGKARQYGKQLLAQRLPDLYQPDRLQTALADCTAADAPVLYWGAAAWLSWIRGQGGSSAAMADLVIVESIMARLLVLAPSYQNSGPRLFFAAYLATKPTLLGGNPERSAQLFDTALAESSGKFLLIPVMYAETYARQMQNQALHDQLLQRTLAFDVTTAPENMLANQIARRRAQRLLAENYFAE